MAASENDQTRRDFNLSLVSLAFGGLALSGCSQLGKIRETPLYRSATMRPLHGYDRLDRDPSGVLDLPTGFTYSVISGGNEHSPPGVRRAGRATLARRVPGAPDGMGAFRLDADRVVLVRNHELGPGDVRAAYEGDPDPSKVYDTYDGKPMPGGTTTIVYNCTTSETEEEYRSLAGTIRNCSGGTTPWGTWLSCEEAPIRSGDEVGGKVISKNHGWVFEVPAIGEGLVEPVALHGLGRFNHEAAAVHPCTGIVYMTEDERDGLFYRFVPGELGNLRGSGELQALGLADEFEGVDVRNHHEVGLPPGQALPVQWITINDYLFEGRDSVRQQGYRDGATRFARGEGIHVGRDEIFFCCTGGGAIRSGQVMRYRPSPFEGTEREREQPGRLSLLVESTDPSRLNYCDNLTVAPNGHIIVCEDAYIGGERNFLFRDLGIGPHAPAYIRGITPQGEVYNIARLHLPGELAGICFSHDGSIMFVNAYVAGLTFAIRGRWAPDGHVNGWHVPQAGTIEAGRSFRRGC